MFLQLKAFTTKSPALYGEDGVYKSVPSSLLDASVCEPQGHPLANLSPRGGDKSHSLEPLNKAVGVMGRRSKQRDLL